MAEIVLIALAGDCLSLSYHDEDHNLKLANKNRRKYQGKPVGISGIDDKTDEDDYQDDNSEYGIIRSSCWRYREGEAKFLCCSLYYERALSIMEHVEY